eukprot:1195915-Rhodomonas_salina.5
MVLVLFHGPVGQRPQHPVALWPQRDVLFGALPVHAMAVDQNRFLQNSAAAERSEPAGASICIGIGMCIGIGIGRGSPGARVQVEV